MHSAYVQLSHPCHARRGRFPLGWDLHVFSSVSFMLRIIALLSEGICGGLFWASPVEVETCSL